MKPRFTITGRNHGLEQGHRRPYSQLHEHGCGHRGHARRDRHDGGGGRRCFWLHQAFFECAQGSALPRLF